MKILLVHSGNAVGGDSTKYTFVRELGEALRELGCEIAYYAVVGKGVRGYLRNVKPLQKKILEFQPDIIHAHYGLSGMVAVLAARKKVPVIITCHNGETLSRSANIITSLAIQRADYTICVAQHIYDKLYMKPKHYMIQPCGIDMKDLPLVDKAEAMKEMNLPKDKINILFGGSFSNARKNAPLANAAIKILNRDDINLIEMRGFNRKQVNLLFCGCDMLLLPTKSEGSPQVLKEAMACNCPVVATDVADIAYLLQGVTNSYVTSFDPKDVADKIQRVIDCGERTNGRERVETLRLDNPQVAAKYLKISKQILNV
ncbi:MAG: glycosyltransferase family 4 protein [Paludibacteraceae bacterium]|nr:glycosyltransferase family 4 protein [Paludibacteraceae bacterium]